MNELADQPAITLTFVASRLALKHGVTYDQFNDAARTWYATHHPEGPDPDLMASVDVVRTVARDFPGGLAAFAAQVKA